MFSKERRSHKRQETFWLVYTKEKHLLGYITDLSLSGLHFFTKESHLIENENIDLHILPPQELGQNPLQFSAQRVWLSKETDHKFKEVGCEFRNLSPQQNKELEQLLSVFSQQRDKFFEELESI